MWVYLAREYCLDEITVFSRSWLRFLRRSECPSWGLLIHGPAEMESEKGSLALRAEEAIEKRLEPRFRLLVLFQRQLSPSQSEAGCVVSGFFSH